jgi:hypothetical protein
MIEGLWNFEVHLVLYLSIENQLSLSILFVFWHVHSKTIAFSNKVQRFMVCESLKALTLQLMSPCCFNFEIAT